VDELMSVAEKRGREREESNAPPVGGDLGGGAFWDGGNDIAAWVQLGQIHSSRRKTSGADIPNQATRRFG
jgi:hypothetical protein